MKKTLLTVFILLIVHALVLAQQNSNSSPAKESNYLKLYLDGAYSYDDYIRQNVTFVNYVRDRFEAEVHLLITTQNTGSGGDEFTLFYFGQKNFRGKNDTLKYIANTNNTEDETRRGLTQILKMGLMRYIAFLPEAGEIDIVFESDSSSNVNSVDKWKNWVFTIGINSFLSGEKSYSDLSAYGSLSADKITEDWKINLDASASYHKTHYDFEDLIYDSKTDSKSGGVLVVKSLGNHWSIGGDASGTHSTYSNYDVLVSLGPAVEYDVFPYSTSTSKIFTFLYSIKPSYQKYLDSTIYDKTEEFLVSQSMQASFEIIEKWGSVSASLTGSTYLHDFSKNQLNLFTSLSWRIVGGLSFEVYGSISLIHDQLNLPKAEASDEEVLTQQKELSTSYSYYTSIGVSYTFGSIFNNVVNPRFNNY